jgi:hypothetical protein
MTVTAAADLETTSELYCVDICQCLSFKTCNSPYWKSAPYSHRHRNLQEFVIFTLRSSSPHQNSCVNYEKDTEWRYRIILQFGLSQRSRASSSRCTYPSKLQTPRDVDLSENASPSIVSQSKRYMRNTTKHIGRKRTIATCKAGSSIANSFNCDLLQECNVDTFKHFSEERKRKWRWQA